MAGGSVAWANSAWADPTETLTLPGAPTSALDRTPVQLQMDIYRPVQSPAPAVVLAHGFGGSKDAVAQEAQFLVERGFVVVAYSARGFGGSTGAISMNAPEFEVADASKIIDYLGDQTYVTQEVAGDPMVGFAGGSYGGALALMIAGYDSRVDAISADITWNDLEAALFAQSTIVVRTFLQCWPANNRRSSHNLRSLYANLVRGLFGCGRSGDLDCRVTGAHGSIVAEIHHRKDHRANAARWRSVRLALPVATGKCECRTDHASQSEHPGESYLARPRARWRRR